MLIIEHKKILDKSNPDRENMLKIHHNIVKQTVEHMSAVISEEVLDELAEMVNEATELALTSRQIETILKVYPTSRAEVIVHGIYDSAALDEVIDSVSHFFLCCNYPTYGDKVDIDKFLGLLKEQVSIFYTIEEED